MFKVGKAVFITNLVQFRNVVKYKKIRCEKKFSKSENYHKKFGVGAFSESEKLFEKLRVRRNIPVRKNNIKNQIEKIC